ncbi:nitric oxide reductase subunit B [Peptococcaceae bacterium CEB3]|nr:nitric oxide reductase subunit B [Peptococcaceae bacterium CEB3]
MKLFRMFSAGASGRHPVLTRPRQQVFLAQKISRRYCLAAVTLFAIQSVVALAGALDLVIPDLPSPIPFEFGRAIHLGFAVLWPLIGTMGMVYYFTAAELNREIFSPRLARWQFGVVLVFALSVYVTLSLRIGNGREYLEGMPALYLGIGLALLLAAYNLVRTLWADKHHITPAAAIMTVGILFLLILLLPNVLHYDNPTLDEAAKFWVVHLWEEMAFELTTAGFIATFFIVAGLAVREKVEKWLYLEAGLAVTGGLYSTGHHYFWIGVPSLWLVLGALISLLEVVPVVMLVQMTYVGLKSSKANNTTGIKSKREKLTLWLILSSLLYHVTGASVFGLMITVPWVNLYVHGTYTTSAHAHLALFGSMGFLVLAGCYYVLSRGSEPTQAGYKAGVLAVLLLNIGLIGMGTALLVAGFLQTYLWRVLGRDFMQVSLLLTPYLLARVLAGGMFALGDFLLIWQIYAAWWRTRKNPS